MQKAIKSHCITFMLFQEGGFAAFILFLSLMFLAPARPAPASAARTAIKQETLQRRRAHPVLTESALTGVWTGEGEMVLVFPSPSEIRQGDLRIISHRAVIRVETGAGGTVNVMVYAEGAGRRGEPASGPVIKKHGDTVTEASAMHLSLQTLQGISWQSPHYTIEDLDSESLYMRCVEVTQQYGSRESYALDLIPGEQPEPVKQPEPGPDMLRADTMRIFMREEEGKLVVVYKGNVSGSYAGVDIRADAAVLWLDTDSSEYEIYARGDVILRRADGPGDLLERAGLETMRADRIYVNPSAERGLVHGPELRMRDIQRNETYVVRGQRAYILDNENLLIRDAGTTNCPHGVPHYEFRAGTLQFIQQPERLFASGWNIRLVAGERRIPLFWLPYLGMNLDDQTYLLRSISAGGSSGFGTTVRTVWAPTDLGMDPGWLKKWNVLVDYYQKRGVGLGTDVEYRFGNRDGISHRGSLRSYYISDRAEEDGLGREVPKSDRGRLLLQHRTDWHPGWRTDLEYAFLSDYTFLREYFRSDFNEEKAPETQLFTRYRADHIWGGLKIKNRINSFMTQRQALPGLELHLLDAPLGPFAYDALFDAGFYEYRLSREESFRDELDRRDPPELIRMHTDHSLSMPFRAGFIKLDPYLRILATHAGKGADSDRDGTFSSSASRIGGGGGFRAAADFSRIYNASDDNLDLNRMRHIVTPYITAEMMEVDGGSGDFIQMRGVDPWPRYGHGPRERDDWIDAIDDTEVLKLGMRQRLQTWRAGRIIDWMRLDTCVVFRSEESVAVADDDNYVEADFDWALTPVLSFSSEDNRFSLDGGPSIFNLGMRWQPTSRIDAALRYNWIEDRTSSIIGRLDMELSDRYSLSVYERYEFDRDGEGRRRNMRTDVVLSRWFHRWLLKMEFYYDGTGDGDRGVFVRFSPSFLKRD